MTALGPTELDVILGLQLTVAWAGEKANGARLGWWDTDLTDREAGGDLFARLLPRTKAWAGFEVAREAARRADEAARKQLAEPDKTATLFHWGFALDEALQDRLARHKRHGRVPAEVFSQRWGVQDRWDADSFARFLAPSPLPKTEATPGGRKLRVLPPDPVEAAFAFAAALTPLGPAYPLPFAPLPELWAAG